MSTTFRVDNVEPRTDYLSGTRPHHDVMSILTKSLKESNIEGCESNYGNLLHYPMNPFAGAMDHAYSYHLPLTLSPDDVWTAITQGLALHVEKHSESLRHHFVSHEGKQKIVVEMPGFRKGDPTNQWKESLGTFSAKIAEHIGNKRDLLVSAFTTTGPVEQAASEVVMMGALKNYFEYYGSTCCGIPNVTLTGTVEDWRSIRRRAEALTEFNLDWWTKELLPVLDQFVNAAEGCPQTEFWTHMYKVSGGSGGPYITGWVATFFPYTINYKHNSFVNHYLDWKANIGHGGMHGLHTEQFPLGLTRVPWTWKYYGEEFKMEFLGGFVGISQDPVDFGVRPAMAWAVRSV